MTQPHSPRVMFDPAVPCELRISSFYYFLPIADVPGMISRVRDYVKLCAETWMQSQPVDESSEDDEAVKHVEFTDIIRGTALISPEGINVTMVGPPDAMVYFENHLEEINPVLRNAIMKSSLVQCTMQSIFEKLYIKEKKEIISTHRDELIGSEKVQGENTGHYLSPATLQEWYEQSKEMVIVDTRNDYEVQLGTFENAIDPDVKTFTEFLTWIDEGKLEEYKEKNIPIVTFCTGGIRCEKVTAYLKNKGYDNVFQLHGGILKYIDYVNGTNGGAQDVVEGQAAAAQEHGAAAANDVQPKTNHWKGECMVFDGRKAVNEHGKASENLICDHCFQILSKECPTCKSSGAEPCGCDGEASMLVSVHHPSDRSNIENRICCRACRIKLIAQSDEKRALAKQRQQERQRLDKMERERARLQQQQQQQENQHENQQEVPVV